MSPHTEPTEGFPESIEAVERLRLPFAFVRRHGVLLLWDPQARLICRDSVALSSIAEVRRLLRQDFVIEQVETEQFDSMLQQSYEQDGSDSMQAMDELDGDLNLSDVAQQLAEPEDLMESQDDAPIIRLINVLLTEAVREDASDIHIESFESSMVVRFRVDGVLREVKKLLMT